jgi:hypothetical protein
MTPVVRAITTSNDVIWNQLASFPFGIGALMFYALLHRAKLLPSWILIWGYISVGLMMAANLSQLVGLADINVVMASLLVQEMVLAGWLIVKGFNPDALDAADDARAKRGLSAGHGVSLPGTASVAGGSSV